MAQNDVIPAGESAPKTPAALGEPVIIVDDLHVDYKVYASGRRVGNRGGGLIFNQQKTGKSGIRVIHALKGVSFVAHRNETIGVVGTNGSGKTTLMRTIAGLLSATSGHVYASSQPNMLGVGASLMPQLSGSRNIVLGCLALGMTREMVNANYDSIVEFAEIGEFIDLPMRTYSSGMEQRLKFAIAAARTQEILIIDEALAVGDARFRVKSESRIREIRDAAGTVFLVSHAMSSIRDTCERTMWIDKGVKVMDGPTEEVVTAYENRAKS